MKRLFLLILGFICWQGVVLAEGEETPKCTISGDTLYYQGSIAEWCKDPITSINYLSLFIDGKEIKGDLVIPEGVDSIKTKAFSNALDIRSLTLPKSLVYLDWCALDSSQSVKKVSTYSDFQNQNFDLDTLCYLGTIEEWCKSPVTSESYEVLFIDEKEIKEDLIIPEGVDTIVSGAFSNCLSLTSVSLPTSLEVVQDGALPICERVKKVSLYSISPFSDFGNYFPNVDTLCYLGTFEEWCESPILDISYSVLCIEGKEIKGDLIIPEGVDTIVARAFSRCSTLTSVSLPNSLVFLDDNAFLNNVLLYSCNCDKVVDGIYYRLDRESKTAEVTCGNGQGGVKYSGILEIPETIVVDDTTYTVTSISKYAFYVDPKSESDSLVIEEVRIPSSILDINSPFLSLPKPVNPCARGSQEVLPSKTSINMITISSLKSLKSLSLNIGAAVLERLYFNGEKVSAKQVLYEMTGSNSFTKLSMRVDSMWHIQHTFTWLYECDWWEKIEILGAKPSPATDSIPEWIYAQCNEDSVKLKTLIVPCTDRYSKENPPLQPLSMYYHSNVNFEYFKGELKGDYVYGCNDEFKYSISADTLWYFKSMQEWCASPIVLDLPYSVLYIDGKEITGDLVIPEGVDTIVSGAFSNCLSLTSVSLPKSLEVVQDGALPICERVKKVSLYSISPFSDFGNYFPNVDTLCYLGTFVEWCASPILDISYSVLYIEGEEVTGDLVIPEGVSHIVSHAFDRCNSLTSVTLPKSIREIEEESFPTFETLYYSDSLVKWCERPFPYLEYHSLFVDGKEITGDLVIPEGVDTIVSGAFSNCLSLTSVSLPKTIEYVGDYAFKFVDTLFFSGSMKKWCEFPISTISYFVLYVDGKEIGGELVIPEGIEYITSGAFIQCPSITSVAFPKSLSSLNENVFAEYTNIRKVKCYSSNPIDNFPKFFSNNDTLIYLGTIGDWCISPLVELPYSILYIDGKEITEDLVIPEGVTSIAEGAFEKCASLISLTFPQSLSYIGENAFAGCPKVRSVTCYSPYPPEAYDNTFANYNGYLYMPCDFFDEYDMHVSWGSFKHVECSSADLTDVDGLQINPDYNHAEFAWPITPDAEVYSLQITRDNELVCTLNFNEDGQLTNIDFGANSSTRSSSSLRSSNSTMSSSATLGELSTSSLRSATSLRSSTSGYKFTVTGLQESTNYNFALDAKDQDETLLKHYEGDFKTKGDSEVGGGTTILEDNRIEKEFTIKDSVLDFRSEIGVAVYDLMGRCLFSCDGKGSFNVPYRGVYLVKIGLDCFKIVVD